MRKLLSIGGAIAALVIVGAATANELGGNAVKSVNATFSAATSSVAWTRSCTGADGTYAATRAVYTGTSSSSEPTLNGPLTLDTQSLINQTTGVGTVQQSGALHDQQGAALVMMGEQTFTLGLFGAWVLLRAFRGSPQCDSGATDGNPEVDSTRPSPMMVIAS